MVAVVNIPAVSTPCISSGVLILVSGAPSIHLLIVAYVGSLSIMLGFESFDSTFNQTVFGAYCQLRMGPWLYSLARSGTGGCGTSAPRVEGLLSCLSHI